MTEVAARYTPAILVGIDGSQQSDTALRWAANQARRRGYRIDAVAAWHLPAGPIEALTAGAGAVIRAQFDFAANAQATLDEALGRCAADLVGVEVTSHAIQGRPTAALVDFAREHNSVLLVVGRRGHGGFAGLILGSTSRACADRAPCPVAVVPPFLAASEPASVTNSATNSAAVDQAVDQVENLWPQY